MQVYLKTLGCRLNEAELEAWGEGFQARGHGITRHAEAADLVVINTCAVTHEAVRKSRQVIRRAHRQNPRAKLVVSGCFASLEANDVVTMEGVDLVVDNRHKDHLVQRACDELGLPTMPALATAAGQTALFSRPRSRAFIKVQDGCRHRCTFCIVTAARGPERSRPIADIVRQINRLVAQGIQEAVLSGVHLGGYGNDLGYRLDDLIAAVLADTDLPRLRLGSLEPWDLADGFFDLFQDPRLMPHLHLPLQSGSDAVLRRMGRRCKTEDYQALVALARDTVEDFNLTTDIIVGFPGESESEWRVGLEFIQCMGFSHMHIFPYSARTGTRAADLPDQVGLDIKRRRSKKLHGVAMVTKKAVLARHVGRVFPVLWEGPGGSVDRQAPAYVHGYTPNYLRVRCTDPTARQRANRIHPGRITALADDGQCALAELS